VLEKEERGGGVKKGGEARFKGEQREAGEGGGSGLVSTWRREKEGEGAWIVVPEEGGLTGGPRPQCRAAAPADRRAWAAQCRVQTDSK
jgi:hypothetical protein